MARRQAASYARKAGAKFLADMAPMFPDKRKNRRARKALGKMFARNRIEAEKVSPARMADGTISEHRNN